jgi:elongator complex protein 4
MSAFVRRTPARAGDAGTRPGLHGQLLLSTGLAGLDRLLGGGLPLGCVLLVLHDVDARTHASSLERCFMGEGVACGHNIAWISTDNRVPDDVAAFLPPVVSPSARSAQQTVSL